MNPNINAPAPEVALKRLVRCQHVAITIQEIGYALVYHRRHKGEWEHFDTQGEITETMHVTCHDCGHKGTYTKGSKSLPNWLREAMDENGI